MYIARRAAQVAGLAGLEWATRITEVVQAAGVPASLWVGGPGSVPGSVAWSVLVESFAEWAEHTERLLADDGYRQTAAEGRDVIVGFQADRLMQVVHGELDGPSDVGTYLGVVEGAVHPERSVHAAAFAADVANAWSATTGSPVVVATNVAGEMDTISWFARFDDAAAVDAANGRIASSIEYASVLARGAGLFTAGVQTYARRVA